MALVATLAAACAQLPPPTAPSPPPASPTGGGDSSGIHWGAVGHNDRDSRGPQYPYNRVPLTTQMDLLTAAGLHWYRTGCTDNCPALLDAARKAGVSLLRGVPLWPDATIDESANYNRAYKYAVDLARANPQFKYWEASNEVDNWIGISGDGSTREQYKQSAYLQARGLIKGLIDGLHAGNPAAKVLVDDAGYCHYGFLKALWDDGVRWDITAFHWYSDQGDMEKAKCQSANAAAIHASFGLPVWITEYNSNIAAKNADDAAGAAWLANFIGEVRRDAAKYRIQAAFVYELLDEPGNPGAEGHF